MIDTNIVWIVIALAVVMVAIIVSVALSRRAARQRTLALRERFGPEYDRALEEFGHAGERVLAKRVQRVADLSVDHPDVVQHYRAARALAYGTAREGLNTEELRQAVVHYRVLFADLLQPTQTAGFLRPSHA